MIDHRKLGRELELFHSAPLVGAGLPIWLPHGAAARHAIEQYLHELERRAGYQHVYSPVLAQREMYERSGHLGHFADGMFPPMPDGDGQLYLRPSLCPHHAMVYASRGRSHRELPLRVGEIGPMYRAERSGVLGGLARVRAISLNDAHVYCRPDQVAGEVAGALALMRRAHAAVGIGPVRYRLSLRGPSGNYAEGPWDLAEAILRDALSGVDFEEAPGEAAFYAPKIDVQVDDPAGREWSISTVQVDFYQAGRFGLSYVSASGEREAPVIVHRSLLGSMERLMGHLIEVHNGAFPAWYAPVQVVAVPVGEAQADAARGFADRAVAAGLRAEAWYDGSVGARVREAGLRRVPYVAVLGEREVAGREVALRDRDGSSRVLAVADAIGLLAAEGALPLD